MGDAFVLSFRSFYDDIYSVVKASYLFFYDGFYISVLKESFRDRYKNEKSHFPTINFKNV